jgi:hypothetical protein
MAGRRVALLVALCATIAVCAAMAGATTIVPISDRGLALSVRAVVDATVVDSEPVWDDARGAVYTYVTLDVERAYKGDVPPGLVVLRQLGGITPEHATVVYGSPDLAPGERVFLYLNADDDGALHVAHLGFGVFRVEPDAATDADTLVRPSFGAPTSPETVTCRADRRAFVADLLATLAASGDDAAAATPLQIVPAEYATALRRGGGARPAFTFLGTGFRWFEPDTRQKVKFEVNSAGAPTPSGGVDEVKAVLDVWSAVQGSRLRVEYGGSTHSGGIKADGVAAIAFGDPRNQIDDLVGCQGIVAMSGLSGDPGDRVTVHGKSFGRLTESDLVVNNGVECIVNQYPSLLSEVLTHEMGHCLGLGHSSESPTESNPTLRDATMFWASHNDGRGASIRLDDGDGIRFAYGAVAGPLALASDAVPDAVPGERYSYGLKADGGSSPYSWRLAAGSLPAGLTLAADGSISGTPTSSGRSSFTARVTDGAGAAQQRSFTLDVTSSPAPFLAAAEFLDSKRKLQLTGRFLNVSVIVTVNGARVAPPQMVKYKSGKGRLLISGSAATLNLGGDGDDVVSVTIGGRTSNLVRF